MKPLNRPMFKYGGPIKEGIMDGMKEKQAINTVGSPLAPKDETGRGGYAFPLIPAIMAGVRALPTVYRGIRTASKFSPSLSGGSIRNLFPTGRFANVAPTIARTKARTVPNASGSYSGVNITANKPLSISQALKDPTRLGQAIRENPFTAGTIGIGAAGQIKNIPDIASGAAGLAADTGLGIANYLLGTDFKRGKKTAETKPGEAEMKIVDKIGEGKGTTGGSVVDDPIKKKQIDDDRIEQTKKRYYELMGLDNMKKDAVYNSLIDASKIISEEGADLKGSIKSGTLQNKIIQAISGQLDKSTALKRQIDAAVLKGEIEKDIKKDIASVDTTDKRLKEARIKQLNRAEKNASAAGQIAAVKSEKGFVSGATTAAILRMDDIDYDRVVEDKLFTDFKEDNPTKNEAEYIASLGTELPDGRYVVGERLIEKKGNEVAFIV